MVTRKKRPEKKPPITSSKPLVGEALCNALTSDEYFTNITQIDAAVMLEKNGIQAAEHAEQVKERELAVLRTITQHPLSEPEFLSTTTTRPNLSEKDPVGETAWRTSLALLANFYQSAGLEDDSVGGQKRADRFLTKALEAIDKINGRGASQGLH